MTYYVGTVPVTPYMEHHGILGQKWGKRNGPPYPLDHEDHSKSEQKAGWKKSLGKSGSSESSKKKTSEPAPVKKPKRKMTDSEKEALKKKVLLGIAIASTATIVGLAAYNRVDKVVIDNMDQILKSGTTLKRIADNNDTSLENAFYAVGKEGEYRKYEGLYGGGQLRRQPGFFGPGPVDPNKHIFRKDIPILKDIKAPSTKVAEQTFKEVFGSNENALKKISDVYASKMLEDRPKYDNLDDPKQLRAIYEAFNRELVYHADADFQKNYIDKFYSALKAKGYSAVLDINDYKYSGYDTKRPMIVFDMDSVADAICKEIDSTTLDKAEQRETIKIIGKQFFESFKWGIPVSAAIAAGGSAVKEQQYKEIEEMEKKDKEKKS